MADPLRLRIQQGLTAVLQSITPANGYAFDLSGPGQVARGRLLFGEGDPKTMITMLEPPEPPETTREAPDQAPKAHPVWDLLLQGTTEYDRQNPTDPAYRLLADVQRRLSEERAKLGGPMPGEAFGTPTNELIGFSMSQGIVRPVERPVDAAFFWLPIRFSIVERYGQ